MSAHFDVILLALVQTRPKSLTVLGISCHLCSSSPSLSAPDHGGSTPHSADCSLDIGFVYWNSKLPGMPFTLARSFLSKLDTSWSIAAPPSRILFLGTAFQSN